MFLRGLGKISCVTLIVCVCVVKLIFVASNRESGPSADKSNKLLISPLNVIRFESHETYVKSALCIFVFAACNAFRVDNDCKGLKLAILFCIIAKCSKFVSAVIHEISVRFVLLISSVLSVGI